MKILNRLSILAFVSLILLSSCKKSLNDAALAIPQNTLSVTAMNLPSMMQKADFESVKNMTFYKKMISESEKDNPFVAEILKEPKKSGVDLTKNVYLVQDFDFGSLTNPTGEMSLLMSLTDVKAFETMLQNAKAGKVVSKDGVKYIKFEEVSSDSTEGYEINTTANGFAAWNDKLAVVGLSSNTEGGKDDFMKYFKTKPEASIAKNAQFQSLFSGKHDIYSYFSSDKIADNMSAKATAGALNIDPKDLKGNYATGYSDFENGEIVSKSDFKINSGITKQWGLMFKNNVNTDFSQYVDGKNLTFAFTMGLDMKGIKEIINANPQFKFMTEAGGASAGFSTEELLKAFDGDMVIAGTVKDSAKWEYMMGLKVQDKQMVDKLMTQLVEKEIVKNEGNGVYAFANSSAMTETIGSEAKISIVDNILFTGDMTTMAQLKNGKTAVKSDVKDVLNKNIFGMYFNFAALGNSNAFGTDAFKDPEVREMTMFLSSKHGESKVKMRNQNENSLKSLFKALDDFYIKSEKEKLQREQEAQKSVPSEI